MRLASAASSARWSGLSSRARPAQPRSRATVSVPALPMRRAKIVACSIVSRRSSPSSSTISPLRRSVNMSSRGCTLPIAQPRPTYSLSLPIASADTSLYMPFSGSRWKVSSIQPRTMSRSSGGTPSRSGDDVGRHPGPEVLHVVERALAVQRVEQAGAQGADVVFEERHPPGREGLGHQPAVAGVLGRVHEDHDLHVRRLGPEHLEHGAVRGAEGLGVAAEGVDVGEAAHGVEVEIVVVVQRRLVAQPPPDRVRVDLVALVERVPGEGRRIDGVMSWPPSDCDVLALPRA